MSSVIVIPARLESQRLGKKLLLAETGKPLILHTVENCLETKYPVFVATDSDEIASVVDVHGVGVVRTQEHPNGTCRIAEAVASIDCQWVVNVQGDEPSIPRSVLIQLLKCHGEITTLAAPILPRERGDASAVKVMFGREGRALYFTRAMIPGAFKHVGVYAYPKEVVVTLPKLYVDPSLYLWKFESLEQMAWMESGHPIRVEKMDYSPVGVNTRRDYEEFKWRLRQSS